MEIKMPRVIKPDGTEIKRLNPIDAKVTLNIMPLSTASLTLRKRESVETRSFVEMYTSHGMAGVFRTKAPKTAYGGQATTVELESAVSEVGDYIIKSTIKDQETTLDKAVKLIFSHYKGTNWKLGGNLAKDPVTLKSVKGNVLSSIIALLKQVPDVRFQLSFNSHPWVINLIKYGTTVEAEGRLSRNVTSASINRDESSLCTRLYVPGINKNGYIQADTFKTYGCIEAELTGTESYTQAQRERVANNYLNAHKQPRVSVNISAVDLSGITGESLDKFQLGRKFRLTIPEDRLTIEEVITQVSWPNVYGDPTRISVTLNQEEESAVTFLEQQQSDIYSAYDYAENVGTTVTQKVEETAEELGLKITKTQTDLTIEAKRAKDAETDLTTQIKINADGISEEIERAKKAENGKISKTSNYKSMSDILDKIKKDADNAATTAKNASIAKTATYKTADSIVQAAVAIAETEAGKTYIAQTSRYQTADKIVDEAKKYVDDQEYDSKIEQQADRIDLVVESKSGQDTIKAAAIAASINGQTGQSTVKLSADVIDIDGLLTAIEAKIGSLVTEQTVARWITAETMHIQQDFFFGPDQSPYHFGPTTVTIGGRQYTILTAI